MGQRIGAGPLVSPSRCAEPSPLRELGRALPTHLWVVSLAWGLGVAILGPTIAPAAAQEPEADPPSEQSEPVDGAEDSSEQEEPSEESAKGNDNDEEQGETSDRDAPEDEERVSVRDRLHQAAKAGRGLDPQDQRYRDRRELLQPTWVGPIGGLRVIDAGSGYPQSVRVIAAGSFSGTHNWLVEGSNAEWGSVIGVNWSPIPWLEVYGIHNHNTNSSISLNSSFVRNNSRTRLGAKAFANPEPWLFFGGDVRLQAPLNAAGNIKAVLGSTSPAFRANVTADLRERSSTPLPIIGRFNLGYLFENSARTIEPWELDNHANLDPELDPAPRPLQGEDRHYLSRAQRFAWHLDRVDILSVGLGLEAPLDLTGLAPLTLSPIAEWVLEAPVNRQGFICLSNPSPGVDGCAGPGNFRVRQATLFGTRVIPHGTRLGITLAGEFGLSGIEGDTQHLHAQAPYRLYFSLTYVTDMFKGG